MKPDIYFQISFGRKKLTLTCSECGVFYEEKIPKRQSREDTNQVIFKKGYGHMGSEHKDSETKAAAALLKEIQKHDAPDRSESHAVLYIESSSSFCGECGRPSLWTPTHQKLAGYGAEGREGCGAVYVAATPLYPTAEDDLSAITDTLNLPIVRSSPYPKKV